MLCVVMKGTLWGAVAGTVAGVATTTVTGSSFYAIFPQNLTGSLFASIFAFAMPAMGLDVARFRRPVSPGDAALSSSPAVAQAARNALTFRHLDGSHGEGCNNEDDARTEARRRFHHISFYGRAVLCGHERGHGQSLSHWLSGLFKNARWRA